MENKCNKTPNNKYLDHVYCHTSESKNYIRANHASGNGAGGAGVPVSAGQDVMALLKENKQLKAMLILHLDLIQEQSDQLMAKDKVLNSLRDEAENLRSKNGQLEAQVQELQKQLQRQIKRVGLAGEVSTLPPPPLAKIQCKMESSVDLNTRPLVSDDFKCEKEEIDVKKETSLKTPKKNYKIQENLNVLEKPATGNGNNIIGECNGKLISKIILHRVNTMGLRSPMSTASDSASELELESGKKSDGTHMIVNITNAITGDELDDDDDDDDCNDDEDEDDEETEGSNNSKLFKNQRKQSLTMSLAIPRGAKPHKTLTGSLTSTLASNPTGVKVCITPPTPSRGGKQMPLMLSHAPELHSDESVSCDSMGDVHQRITSISSPSLTLSPKEPKQHSSTLAPPLRTNTSHYHHHHLKSRRCGYISTPHLYCTREWEDAEFVCEYEFMKEDINALQDDSPMLEIPKWTEHEISVSYCIEGTEDLSNDTFLKRHAKLEVDEKRRKKWDVQQIREQRRIEKLKRRHCKDELQNAPEQQPMLSFYPQPDAIQTVCFMNDLPVQAFGEVIPKLNTNTHFTLPWLDSSASSNFLTGGNTTVVTLLSGNMCTSAQAQQQLLNSSFVFMKKRRRQQSASVGAPTTRQRQALSAPRISTATTQQHQIVTATPVPLVKTLNSSVNPTEASKD